MKTQERVEHRFFITTEECEMLINQITMFSNLNRCYFNQPVTEIIYFTLCDPENSIYADLYIRVRKYVKQLSKIIVLDNSSAYLEIKSKGKNCINFKKRHLITGEQIIKILFRSQEKLRETLLLDCPPLRPFVGTQSKRLHWQTEGIRLTVDPETYFFGFTNTEINRGYQMGNLGEVKIEFKYDDKSLIDYQDEKRILANLNFYPEPTPNYMERKIRECYAQWIKVQ